jgi:hypothetical protein
MTAFGKILVFINFIFSLVVSGLIVMVYITRADWADTNTKLNNALAVARADEAAAVARVATIERTSKDTIDALTRKEANTAKALEDVRATLKTEQDKLAASQTALNAQAANTTQLTNELTRLKGERDQLVAIRTDRDAKVLDLTKQVNDFRNEATQNLIAYNTMKERNNKLLDQVDAVTRERNALATRLGTNPTATVAPTSVTAQPTKPATDVRGSIAAYDIKNKLATITVGTDAGVAIGNTLEVFRLQPEPLYLGTLKILTSEPRQSVGRFEPAPAARGKDLLKTDEVASRIVTTPGAPTGR